VTILDGEALRLNGRQEIPRRRPPPGDCQA
jgi:hypothetical protein